MKIAALASAACVLPFLVLEAVNGGGFDVNFPIALFLILWLLGFVVLLVTIPMVRQLRTRGLGRRDALAVVFKAAVAVSLASMWLLIVVDQMPCFLGVPNCD